MSCSIIIPVLNEVNSLQNALAALQFSRSQGTEIILVDGGSVDGTLALAKQLQGSLFDKLVASEQGRSLQMNAGAAIARHQLLVFLHIDTTLDQACYRILAELSLQGQVWGRFDVRLSGRHFLFRVIEKMINLRSRITGVATGDQVLFISKPLFEAVGGFAELPLMEDIELAKRLRKICWPVCPRLTVKTSSRRWEESGILKTVCLMWCLRLAYFLGVPPQTLVKYYG